MSFEEQIMSKDKYPSIFSCKMVAIVFIIFQIFSATRAVLKVYNNNNKTYIAPISIFLFSSALKK